MAGGFGRQFEQVDERRGTVVYDGGLEEERGRGGPLYVKSLDRVVTN